MSLSLHTHTQTHTHTHSLPRAATLISASETRCWMELKHQLKAAPPLSLSLFHSFSADVPLPLTLICLHTVSIAVLTPPFSANLPLCCFSLSSLHSFASLYLLLYHLSTWFYTQCSPPTRPCLIAPLFLSALSLPSLSIQLSFPPLFPFLPTPFSPVHWIPCAILPSNPFLVSALLVEGWFGGLGQWQGCCCVSLTGKDLDQSSAQIPSSTPACLSAELEVFHPSSHSSFSLSSCSYSTSRCFFLLSVSWAYVNATFVNLFLIISEVLLDPTLLFRFRSTSKQLVHL